MLGIYELMRGANPLTHSVLIVSDDEACYPMIQQVLEAMTITCHDAANCHHALAYLDSHAPPTIVVLDNLSQPEDTATFLGQLDSRNTNTQILALGESNTAFEPDAMLLKPLHPTDVLFVIEQLLIPVVDTLFSPLDAASKIMPTSA